MDSDHQSERRRGRKKLCLEAKRRHCISCWVSDEELITINLRRGKLLVGQYLRHAALNNLPQQVPEINQKAYSDLGRAMSNIAQITRRANAGQMINNEDITEIRVMLRDIRDAVRGRSG